MPIAEIFANPLMTFILTLARVGALVTVTPMLGAAGAPARVRAALALVVSAMVTLVYWGAPAPAPANLLQLGVMVAGEAAWGLALGMGVAILFMGLQATGQLLGEMSGMQLAESVDPNFETSTPLFGQVLNLVALAVFVLIGGHRQVMSALLDSFVAMPPGHAKFSEGLTTALVDAGAQSFELGVRAAAPVLTAVLLATLVLGFINRTLPQLNVMAVGFSLNTMLTIAGLAVTLGAAAWIFQEQVEPLLDRITNVGHSLAK
ncbi:MAG: flagellar biosynthetic protein FliR [Planctomycetes bacterium]|nr:flagellar biosynthetic protein FliR [Planctomycetota bacterium]